MGLTSLTGYFGTWKRGRSWTNSAWGCTRMFDVLYHVLADWQISQVDRHLLSYCVSLHNTHPDARECVTKGMEMDANERQKFVHMLSKKNINVI